MAAFGIPQAHEDDSERALRAAIAIDSRKAGDVPSTKGVLGGSLS
jgi:imidazoleglycerol phosphate dehydratase HisB